MKLAHWHLNLTRVTLCLLLLSFALPSLGQNSRGTILGHVKDPSAAAVQGAKVTAKNVNTGVTNEFTTSAVGDYVFVDLIPGTYTVTVESQGFKTERSTGLILEVDQTLRQDFTLAVGSFHEEVRVTADTQMVQTDNTTLGNVLDQKMLEDLPLNGRDFTNLLNLTAGATNLSGGTQATGYVLHGLSNFTEISLNGARPDSISYMVDGVSDNDAFFSGSSSVPSEFALQEVKIQTGLYSAEYGQGSGQVNVAIKSGTNQWHGQAYDYIQNDMFNPESPLIKAFNAFNNTNNPLKTPFKQNQFGGTLGGPVRIPWLYNGVNKSFWFFAYDGGRRSFFSGVQTAIQVPTSQERNGNFSDWPYPIYDPSTTGSVAPTPTNPSGRTAFPNNQITNINTIGQKLANLYPAPNINCTFPCNNYVQQIHNSIDTDNITMRVDQNFHEKDRIFFTGHIRQDDEPNPSQLPYTGSTAFTHSRLFGLSWQHSLSARTINEVRIGYNHQWFHSGDDTAFGPNLSAQLGFSNAAENPALYGIPLINQDYSYSSIGNNNPGTSTKHTSWQFVDNLKLISGKHTLTVGADIRRLREFESDTYQGIGTLNFDGKYTASDPTNAGSTPGPDFGNPTADMLLGDPVSVTPPYPFGVDLLDVRGTNWNFFFQDDFRVTPRVTVNLGLRYELPPNFHSVDNSGWSLDPANGGSLSWVSRSFVQGVEQTASAQAITVNPNFLNCCLPNTLVPIDKKDFAPRIGVSWRPFATDRFVVRAGYGIFYDTYMRYYDLVQNFDSNTLQTQFPNSYPSGTGQETASPVQLNTLWLPTVSSSQFFSLPGWDSPGFSSPILNQVEWPYNHNPYIQQWTLDTQYALRQNLLLDIGYVGSHDTHLPTQNLYNAAYQPTAAAAVDPCNYSTSTGVIFDASQLPAGSPCLTDPNFSPVDTRVPYPNLPSIVYANANVLSANYNALQVQLRQRFWRGLTYQISYAWSRAFDEASGIVNVGGISEFIQDPHNIKGDYGPASFDQPQRLTASASWSLPVGRGQHWSLGWADWVVGGWKLSGINSLSSGRTFSVYPFGFFDNVDLTGSNFGGRYRANEISNPERGFSRNPSEWINTSAFAAPAVGTYGNEVKGSLRGPYFEDLDLSFGKEFPITERQRLQYRLELFNTGSNWHSMARIPDGGMGDNNFGSIVPFNSPGLSTNVWNNLNLWTPHTIQMSLVYSF
ncbi:MAG: carboxypeptidase regulatory-like domain-containing protein [Candidatus Sulfotelmatobacter sp.]